MYQSSTYGLYKARVFVVIAMWTRSSMVTFMFMTIMRVMDDMIAPMAEFNGLCGLQGKL